jgi:hypothetical protein
MHCGLPFIDHAPGTSVGTTPEQNRLLTKLKKVSHFKSLQPWLKDVRSRFQEKDNASGLRTCMVSNNPIDNHVTGDKT